jgi:hypothetical protein
MSKWTFFGRILPERVPITWPGPLSGSAESGLGFAFDYRVVIHHSQIVIDLEIEKDAPDLATLRNTAAEIVRAIADLISYQTACGYEVEIVSAVCHETDEWEVFGINIRMLAAQRKVQGTLAMEADLLIAVTSSAAAQVVLANFRAAMRVPVDTGFFCYRAIEAMMQSMKSTPGEKDGSAWDRLREKLCIDRTAIDEVKKHADVPRHGNPSAITDAERAAVFALTDEMIRRFLQFLVRGEKSNRPRPPKAGEADTDAKPSASLKPSADRHQRPLQCPA